MSWIFVAHSKENILIKEKRGDGSKPPEANEILQFYNKIYIENFNFYAIFELFNWIFNIISGNFWNFAQKFTETWAKIKENEWKIKENRGLGAKPPEFSENLIKNNQKNYEKVSKCKK